MTIEEQIAQLKAELAEKKARSDRQWLEFKTAEREANIAKAEIDKRLAPLERAWFEAHHRAESIQTTIRELERFGSL